MHFLHMNRYLHRTRTKHPETNHCWSSRALSQGGIFKSYYAAFSPCNCYMDMLSVYASADQSSQARAKSCWLIIQRQQVVNASSQRLISCQLSVPAPHPKLIPAPESLTQANAHEVMNQLYTPNPHSVIASDVEPEMCRSIPPQLCLTRQWTRVCSIESECPSPKLSIKPWVSTNTDKPTHMYMHLNTGHHHLREQIPAASGGSAQTWRERPNCMAGATKLGGRRERPNSATVMMYLWETLTAKLCCSDTRVQSIGFFVPDWICRVGMVI